MGTLRMLALAAGGAALLGSAPLIAGRDRTTRAVENWDVARSKQGACMMTATFQDDDSSGPMSDISLSVIWDKPQQQVGILAASRSWGELLEAEGNPTSLQLGFDGQVAYPQWLYEGARFQRLNNSMQAVMGVWGEDHRAELVEALTRSRTLAVKIGESDLGAFDISGADKAYRELLRCGERG